MLVVLGCTGQPPVLAVTLTTTMAPDPRSTSQCVRCRLQWWPVPVVMVTMVCLYHIVLKDNFNEYLSTVCWWTETLLHYQDTIHGEKGCTEMHDFCMFLTGHWIKARTHAHVEITHFSMRCIIMAWEAWDNRPSAFQILMMHSVGKCAISAQAWVLAIWPKLAIYQILTNYVCHTRS